MLATRQLLPVAFGAHVERSSPNRLCSPPRLYVAADRRLGNRAIRNCRRGCQAGVLAGHRDRVREGNGDNYRIFVNDLPPLRSVWPERLSDAAIKAAAASILARCIGKGDPEKYLGAIETLFKLQDRLMAQTKDTLFYVGKLHGMSVEEVETCEKDQTQFDKLNADQQYAARELKVTSTPTFFLNGVRLQGSMSFEELEERIKPLMKK